MQAARDRGSGAGTTTLGRAVADAWSVPHAEADDYFWEPSDPPYVVRRPEADRLALMRSVFVPREAWVLSGSSMEWGDSVVDLCEVVVFLTLDPAERMRRLEEREVARQEGRDPDPAAWQAFLEWARSYDDPAFGGRSRVAHWTTFLASGASDGPPMHPWSPPGHRQRRSTLEVQHEFCGVRWPRTLGPATGLCASERRSVSDRRWGPGTTGWIPTAATARNPL